MIEIAPTQDTAGSEVFVSYASPDATIANTVVGVLEQHGIRCWIAPRDVRAGAQYADAIVRAISGAKALVLVLSANAIDSTHVGKEVERASAKKRPIIALRTDNAPLTPALEYFLSESQWIEAQTGKEEAAFAKLVTAVRDPARPGHAAGALATPAAGTLRSHPRSRRNGFLLGAALTAIALAFLAFWAPRLWPPGHTQSLPPANAPVSATAIADKSIAVLPFVDMSEKHDQEYFGDGMAEEILDLLVRIPGLRVVGRTSSFSFKGRNEDLRTIGAKLNAAHVLEGSVRKSGNQLRVTAQLIDTHNGVREWSETFDRPVGEVLKLQDSIAGAVARELQLTVAPDNLSARQIPKSVAIYELYLRGRHALDRHDSAGLDEAARLFQKALDRDPAFANAAVWLAETRSTQAQVGNLPPAAAFEQARRAASAALELEPNNAGAHAALANIYIVHDWDWDAAARELQKVEALAPGSADAMYGASKLSLTMGRWDDALAQINASLTQDPLEPNNLLRLLQLQARLGHMAEAETAARRLLDIHPTFAWAHYYLGLTLLARGDRSGALRSVQLETADNARQQGLAILYGALGRKADAAVTLAAMLRDQANTNAVGIADVYALRGNFDEAMHWLERAYVQKDPELFFVKGESELNALRSDRRYKAFLRKMNLPE